MSSLQIGRLTLGPPLQWYEQAGSATTSQGGGVVPNTRTAPQYQVSLGTYAADGQTDTPAARLILRRQLRSMLNNDSLKFQYAYLYVIYSDDPEQNGWYVPDQASLQDYAQAAGLATGFWQLSGQNLFKVGARRTHREARAVWMKQLNLSTPTYPRDTLGWIISADFSALPALALSVLPNGATSAIQTVSGAVVSGPAMPTGRDGGACQIIQGLTDLLAVSYERPEAAINLSDVIVYDRMGQITAPSTGPDTSWLELYGPDWPWNWQTAGQPNDAPVLDNGLVRVRYDASVGKPGFRVDVWNGSAYVEQGKLTVYRIGDVSGYCDTFVSAGLHTDNQNGGWTPDRAVAKVVLANSADAYSREQVFITVQRGELTVQFECYPALKGAGTQADCAMEWTPALNSGTPDVNNSVFKSDSQTIPPAAGAVIDVATAGAGAGTGNSGEFTNSSFAALGASSFANSENWIAILRCPLTFAGVGAYQTTLSVLQGANALAEYAGSQSAAYAGAFSTNAYRIQTQNAAGYLQIQVGFAATQAQQVLEAESMTLGTGTSTAADAAASGTGSNTTTATRTSDANAHVTQATWPNGFTGTYRLFARVKVSSGSLTGSFYARAGTTGSTVTTSSTSYVWLDLGDIAANNSTLQIHAWLSAAGTVYVDRIEAILVQDRARSNAIYSGSRDQGQAALNDSRMLGAVVVR